MATDPQKVLVNPRFNSFTPVGQSVLAGVAPKGAAGTETKAAPAVNAATARGDVNLRGSSGGDPDTAAFGQGHEFSPDQLAGIADALGVDSGELNDALGGLAYDAGRGVIGGAGGVLGGLGGAILGTMVAPGIGTLAGAQLGGRLGNYAGRKGFEGVFGAPKTEEEKRQEQLAEERSIAAKKEAEARAAEERESGGGGLFGGRGGRDFGDQNLNDLADGRGGFGGGGWSAGAGAGLGGGGDGLGGSLGAGTAGGDWASGGFGGFGGGLSFGTGGPVPGPVGKPVPATVHGGEHVMTEDAVAGAGGGDIGKGLELMQALMQWFEQQQALTGSTAQPRGPLSSVRPGQGG